MFLENLPGISLQKLEIILSKGTFIGLIEEDKIILWNNKNRIEIKKLIFFLYTYIALKNYIIIVKNYLIYYFW